LWEPILGGRGALLMELDPRFCQDRKKRGRQIVGRDAGWWSVGVVAGRGWLRVCWVEKLGNSCCGCWFRGFCGYGPLAEGRTTERRRDEGAAKEAKGEKAGGGGGRLQRLSGRRP